MLIVHLYIVINKIGSDCKHQSSLPVQHTIPMYLLADSIDLPAVLSIISPHLPHLFSCHLISSYLISSTSSDLISSTSFHVVPLSHPIRSTMELKSSILRGIASVYHRVGRSSSDDDDNIWWGCWWWWFWWWWWRWCMLDGDMTPWLYVLGHRPGYKIFLRTYWG